tara:strand:+ start:148 stop:336 length:189 start_codon:yes stop_codon:yes gene_type:complete
MTKAIDIRTGKVYNSAKEISDEFNIPHSTVRCWLNGSRKNYSTFKVLVNGNIKETEKEDKRL